MPARMKQIGVSNCRDKAARFSSAVKKAEKFSARSAGTAKSFRRRNYEFDLPFVPDPGGCHSVRQLRATAKGGGRGRSRSSRVFIRSEWQSHGFRRATMYVANHFCLSCGKIDIGGLARCTDARNKNPDRGGEASAPSSYNRKMAAGENAGLLLRGSHASGNAEVVLVETTGRATSARSVNSGNART